MTPEQLRDLRAKCEAATLGTPGWHTDHGVGTSGALFIAAASPDKVKWLLAENESLRELVRWAPRMAAWHSPGCEEDQLCADDGSGLVCSHANFRNTCEEALK